MSDNKIKKENKLKQMTSSLQNEDGMVKVILTKEIEDRDGEVIKVAGVNIDNFRKNPIVLDTHRHNTSIEDIIGRMPNVEKTTDANGIPMIVGEVEFADTPKGQLAKKLVDKNILKTVSIGFSSKDFDVATRTITESELFEVSFVSVPANPEATTMKNAKIKELVEADDSKELFKVLENYLEIHPRIKQYRKLLLGEELTEKLGYEKTGEELKDLKAVYDLIVAKLNAPKQVTPARKSQEAKTSQYVTKKQVKEAFDNVIKQIEASR